MKLGKKLIALVTVFMMVFGGIPMMSTAFAADDGFHYVDRSSGLDIYGHQGILGINQKWETRKWRFSRDSKDYYAYCKTIDEEVHESESYTREGIDGGDAAKIRAIMYADTSGYAEGVVIAAKQAAIWHWTENFVLEDYWTLLGGWHRNNDEVKALYAKLIDQSQTPPANPVGDTAQASLTVTFSKLVSYNAGDTTKATLEFNVNCSRAVKDVVLTPSSGTVVGSPTLAVGNNTIQIQNANTTGTFTLTVTAKQDITRDVCQYSPECPVARKFIGLKSVETISLPQASGSINFGSIIVKKSVPGASDADNGTHFYVTIGGGAFASGLTRQEEIWAGNTGGTVVAGLPYANGYTIQETDDPGDGYTPSASNPATFNIPSGLADNTLTFTNTPHGHLKITKTVDGDTDQTFHISVKSGSTEIASHDFAKGESYTFGQELGYGSYTITETPKTGFRILGFDGDGAPVTGDPYSYTVNINSTTTEEVTVRNQKLSKIIIHKVDNLGDNLSGVRFEYRMRTGNDPETWSEWTETGLTVNTGIVEIKDLIPGHYEVREKTAPSGYDKDTSVKTADLDAGETETLADFVNEGHGNIIVRKVDASGNLLPGASFKVVQPDGDTHYASDTNNDGIVVFTGLTIGKWVVTETAAPAGYYLDPANPPSQTINKLTVNGATLTFTNYPDVGSLKIKKIDAQTGSGMVNVEFQLSTVEDFSSLVTLADSTTDANGELQIDNLPSGTYYIRETPGQNASGALLAGYLANDTVMRAVVSYNTVTVVDYQGDPLTFANVPWQKIEVNKQDTGEKPILIAGAVFYVYKKVGSGPYDKVAELTTDANGIATSDMQFAYGTPDTAYYVKEITPPAGYGISDDDYKVVPYIGPGETANVYFFDYKLGSITVTKAMKDDVKGTATYEFVITRLSDNAIVDTFSIAADGSHTTPNLEYGRYMIHETIPTNASFRLVSFNSQEFGLQESNDYIVDIGAALKTLTQGIAAPKALDVSVTCTNQLLGKIQVTKKDAASPTKYLAGAQFTVASLDDPAKTFPVLETGAGGTDTTGWLVPGDYTVTETKAPDGYHIDDDQPRTLNVKPGETIGWVFTDSLGSVLIHKSSSYGDKPAVQGVLFQLLKSAPAADGTVPEGDIIGTATTGADGNAEFKGLMIGQDYWVRELQQAPGYNIDKTVVYKVTASYKPDKAAATFVNDPVGSVKVTKVDQADDKVKLAGAVFGVYSDAECKTLVDTLAATDSNGFSSSKELAFGAETIYYVKEITAPSGYILSTEVQEAKFTTPGQVVELQFKDVRNVGSLVIKKIDGLTKAALAGAEFKLYSDAAMTAQVGNAVTTGSDGIVRFDNLVPGEYWLYESKAPENYDQLTAALKFTVAAGDTNPTPQEIQNQYNPPEDIQTGMMDWNVLLIGGIALLAGVLLVIYTRKRRMNTNVR